MPGDDDTPPLRYHWPAALLAASAALVAVLAQHHLFPALSWNRDEPVYLWHMELLRQGQLTATDGGHPDLFLPWLSATRDGLMFTQYTLGWPLVLLAARVVTGTAASALPLSAALAVLGTYAFAFELSQRRRVAWLAGALLVASPILAVQGGVYLSYLFTVGLGLSAGALLLSGVRRGRPGRHPAAGFLLGWIFLTRPYDAFLWGGAFALGLLITEAVRRREVVRALLIAAASATPFVAAVLLYNRHVTGEPLTFPITAADPLDGFGFGVRRLMPGFDTIDYGPADALRASAKNAALFPWFLVGGYVGALVGLVGLWHQRHQRVAVYTVLVALAFPLGYLVFWGTYLSSLASRISGPIYLVPLYAVVSILSAAAIDRWWAQRRSVAVAVLAGLALATLPGAITRFGVNRDISQQQEAWRDGIEGLRGPSIVFVADTGRYVLFANPFSRNRPDLDGEVLYASAGSPSMLDLIDERPERVPYLQAASLSAAELGPREDPNDLEVRLTPIEVRRADVLELTVRLEAPRGTESATIVVDTGVDSLRTIVAVGTASTSLRVVLGGDGAGALTVAERGFITVTADYEGTSGGASIRSVRQTTPYRTDGATLEVITPFAAQRYEPITDDISQWWHIAGLPELRVELIERPG